MEDYHGGDGDAEAATEVGGDGAAERRHGGGRVLGGEWTETQRGAAAAAWRRKVLLLPGRGSTRGTSAGIYRGRALVPGGGTDRY